MCYSCFSHVQEIECHLAKVKKACVLRKNKKDDKISQVEKLFILCFL